MVLTLKLWQVIVSEKTTWLFISGTDDTGLTGFGEATANHHIAEIIARFNNAIDIAARCDLGISAKLAQIRHQIPGKPATQLPAPVSRPFWISSPSAVIRRYLPC